MAPSTIAAAREGWDGRLSTPPAGNQQQFLSQMSITAGLGQASGDLDGMLTSQEEKALRDRQVAGQQLAAAAAPEAR